MRSVARKFFWFQELEADNFVFTSGMYAQLAEVYAHHDKIQEMWDTVKKLQEKEPDFPVDSMKIIKIVALLIKNNRVSGKRYLFSNLFVSSRL